MPDEAYIPPEHAVRQSNMSIQIRILEGIEWFDVGLRIGYLSDHFK